MKESILVYYTVMQKFIAYAAVASFFFSIGVAVDGETGTLANFARAFCIIWSLLIFAALGLWVRHEGHAQAKQHEMQMALLQADIDSIAPPAPEAAPPAPRVPFPPESFVEFIWKWRDEHGKFPTIQECVDSGINAQLAQYRYQQMVDAGYIVNRIERKSSGEPARSREDFIAAAIADNTLRQT